MCKEIKCMKKKENAKKWNAQRKKKCKDMKCTKKQNKKGGSPVGVLGHQKFQNPL